MGFKLNMNCINTEHDSIEVKPIEIAVTILSTHLQGKQQLLAAAAAKLLQLCLTLCDPIDGSPPGSAVPGISRARILERVAISFSKGSS